jgi:hypothetical protein
MNMYMYLYMYLYMYIYVYICIHMYNKKYLKISKSFIFNNPLLIFLDYQSFLVFPPLFSFGNL